MVRSIELLLLDQALVDHKVRSTEPLLLDQALADLKELSTELLLQDRALVDLKVRSIGLLLQDQVLAGLKELSTGLLLDLRLQAQDHRLLVQAEALTAVAQEVLVDSAEVAQAAVAAEALAVVLPPLEEAEVDANYNRYMV